MDDEILNRCIDGLIRDAMNHKPESAGERFRRAWEGERLASNARPAIEIVIIEVEPEYLEMDGPMEPEKGQ